jgi:hypothetical protein
MLTLYIGQKHIAHLSLWITNQYGCLGAQARRYKRPRMCYREGSPLCVVLAALCKCTVGV